MDIVDEIENNLRTEDSPTVLAAHLTRLAAELSYRNEQLKKIMLIKPQAWLQLQNCIATDHPEFPLVTRDKALSDRKTEMEWAATEDGKKETALTFEIKRLSLMTSAIRTRLYTLKDEMTNLKTY